MRLQRATGRWRTGAIAFALATVAAQACKYNVRDAGFVDFDPAPYRLLVVTNEAFASAAWGEELRHVVAASWLDANVELALGNVSDLPRAARAAAREDTGANAGMAVLLAPDGRALPRRFPSGPDRDAVWSLVEGVVDSPLRQRLAQALVESFAVILLAEGPREEENDRAKAAARGAISRFAERLPRLPKPVKEPPMMITAPLAAVTGPGDREREAWAADQVALWSLELSSANRQEPEVAVVYGRGRRSGPPLRGPEITETALLEVLTILGQDCECDLDRSWLRGPLMPLRWGADLQQQVVKELGFDAENPMVKTEIARIIARGPNPSVRRVAFDEGADDLFGYAEIDLDESPAESSVEPPPAEPPPAATESGVTTNLPASGAPAGAASGSAAQPIARMSLTLILLIGAVVIGVALVFLFSSRSD